MSSPECDILLGTFNGARWLPAQLDSLLQQTDQDFRLLVRDDGSSDGTCDILRAYADRFGDRFRLVKRGRATGSARGNFSVLMEESEADHVLFCDQDDVWSPNKVAVLRRLLADAEARFGPDAPVYAATDLTAVDEALKPIAESFWAYKRTDPELVPDLSRSLLTGAFLGCASGINRALNRMARPVPPKATNHDWWSIQVAILFGHVVWSPEQTVLYRIHGANLSRPQEVSARRYMKARGKVARIRRGLKIKTDQARELLFRFGDQIPREKRRIVEEFVGLPDRGFLGRRISVLRWRFLYPDHVRNAAFLLAI